MSILFAFLPLVVFVTIPSIIVKLAARLTRTKLSWQHCFVFGAIVALASVVGRVMSTVTVIALPMPVAILFGAVINVGLGVWYFNSRALDKEGRHLATKRRVKLMIVYLLLLGIVAGSMFTLAYVLIPRAQPNGASAANQRLHSRNSNLLAMSPLAANPAAAPTHRSADTSPTPHVHSRPHDHPE